MITTMELTVSSVILHHQVEEKAERLVKQLLGQVDLEAAEVQIITLDHKQQLLEMLEVTLLLKETLEELVMAQEETI